jgi:hypothetical protein
MHHHSLRGHKSKSVNHKVVKSRVCLLKFKWAKGSASFNATFNGDFITLYILKPFQK